jgi:hypothetical protein
MKIRRSRSQAQFITVARRYSLAIFALATVSFATFGFSPEAAAQQETGRVRDVKKGFSFVPPAGWEVSDLRPDPSVRLLYLGPGYRGGRANVNLVVEEDDGASFSEISQQMKEMYPRLFHGWKLAEEAPIEIGGKKTYYLSATHRVGTLTLRQAQFLVRGDNGKIYIVTFAAANDVFDRLSPAIAQSALSIRIE